MLLRLLYPPPFVSIIVIKDEQPAPGQMQLQLEFCTLKMISRGLRSQCDSWLLDVNSCAYRI